MFGCAERISWELSMSEVEYVECPSCAKRIKLFLDENIELKVHCKECDYEFVVVLLDQSATQTSSGGNYESTQW